MLQHSFWFFLRSRHQTFQGVQQTRLLTYFLSSLFLSSFLGLVLAQVTRGRLLLVRRLGFSWCICSEVFCSTPSPSSNFASHRFLSLRIVYHRVVRASLLISAFHLGRKWTLSHHWIFLTCGNVGLCVHKDPSPGCHVAHRT